MDFLVIGAGVSGLAVADQLLRRGGSVSVLDRGAVGQESSWAGGGILSPLCPWDYSAAVNQLALRGMALFPAFASELHQATGIDPEYQTSGLLVLPPFDRTRAESWCADHQLAVERIPASRVLPHLSADALLLPGIGQVRNPRLIQALRRRVELGGGKIIEHCAVTEIAVQNGRVRGVHSSQGEWQAGQYIVTTGAWTRNLLAATAAAPDIRPVRGQMLLYRFDTPPLRHIVLQDGLYLIPRRDGHLLVGSTLEEVGFDKSTTATALHELSQHAARLLPALRDRMPVRHWAGLRPGSPDNLPHIGRHATLGNLWLNAGHFRYGVTMAPASAEKLMNCLLTGQDQP